MDTGSAGRLKSRLRSLVGTSIDEPVCRAAALTALSRRGYALHPEGPCRAGVLSLETYRLCRGTLDDAALNAAVAVELLMEAAYVFDDIADGDHIGDVDEALAGALQLLSVGYRIACGAARGISPPGSGFRALGEFHDHWFRATTGFYLDARRRREASATLTEAVEMTRRKSGALGRFAASFGAEMAGARVDLATLLGELGESLFTYRQLVDDLRDAFDGGTGPSDLERHKQTVPVVYVACASSHTKAAPDDRISVRSLERVGEAERREASFFGTLLAETFLNRAKTILAELKETGRAVRNLERIVDSIEAATCDTVPD